MLKNREGKATVMALILVPVLVLGLGAATALVAHAAGNGPDTSAPSVGASISGTLGNNGWYVSDVRVTWNVIDNESAITTKVGCNSVTITADTPGISLNCTATSAGGTASQSVTIKRDATPPTTGASVSPIPNAAGWNDTDVMVTLTPTDNLSGVNRLKYRINFADLLHLYTVPFSISNEGITTLTYRSADNAGNTEPELHTLVLRIDKTAPEAHQQFDPLTKDVAVLGRDALSGAPASPVAPISVTPTTWAKEEDAEDEGEQGKAELRTYRVVDAAGNSLVLVAKVKRTRHQMKVRIVSLQYDLGPVMNVPQNQMGFRWHTNKDGSLKELEQKLEVGKGRDRQKVTARYDGKKDQSSIRVSAGASDDDGPIVVQPGLILLRLATDQGNLVIQY